MDGGGVGVGTVVTLEVVKVALGRQDSYEQEISNHTYRSSVLEQHLGKPHSHCTRAIFLSPLLSPVAPISTVLFDQLAANPHHHHLHPKHPQHRIECHWLAKTRLDKSTIHGIVRAGFVLIANGPFFEMMSTFPR